MHDILLLLSLYGEAVFAGVLIALSCALLGVNLVLKRYSMIGDGLSHVSFGALSIGLACGVAPMAIALPVVIIAAFFLLRASEKEHLHGDAAIALLSSGALAIGILVSHLFQTNMSVEDYMFGSLYAIDKADFILSVALALCVLVLFVLFYNKIFAVTFDESFAKATGVHVSRYNSLVAVLTAVTVVVGMRMMGALLISSLIIFPAITAMRIFKSFKSVTIASGILSVLCFLSGVILSFTHRGLPTGATIVVVNLVVFVLVTLFSKKRA